MDSPLFLLSALIIAYIADLVGLVPWGCLIVAAWLASGPVVLLRRVEDALVSSREDVRRPSADEQRRLGPAWEKVTQAAGVDQGAYRLWVQQSGDINAFVTAGHTVAVTERAVQSLPPAALEAVLAHELGHHLGGHTWASLLRYWYSFPALYSLRFGTYLSLALLSAFSSGNVAMSVAVAAGVAVVVGLLVASLPVVGVAVAVAVLAPFGVLWLKRAQEHKADSVAVRLGYGTELASMLRGTSRSRSAGQGSGTSWLARVGATHPGDAERVQRIQEQLDQDGHARAFGRQP
jgi:STE24 endopeptidase